jgi:hypothetical protein
VYDISDIADLPSKSDTTAVAHAVTEDLAGNNMVARKNGIEFLEACQILVTENSHKVQLTDSLRRFGRLERYKFVDPSSPSAFSLALKLS